MTYQQLTYFYYAAKTLNFSKAAQLCFVVQTAISKPLHRIFVPPSILVEGRSTL